MTTNHTATETSVNDALFLLLKALYAGCVVFISEHEAYAIRDQGEIIDDLTSDLAVRAEGPGLFKRSMTYTTGAAGKLVPYRPHWSHLADGASAKRLLRERLAECSDEQRTSLRIQLLAFFGLSTETARKRFHRLGVDYDLKTEDAPVVRMPA